MTMTRRRRGTRTATYHVEYTPNGGRITRAGPFTFMDGPGLEHYCDTDPICRQWRLADELCDRQLLRYPELPASDPYNRPGYPYSDPQLWTPDLAIRFYGCHLVH